MGRKAGGVGLWSVTAAACVLCATGLAWSQQELLDEPAAAGAEQKLTIEQLLARSRGEKEPRDIFALTLPADWGQVKELHQADSQQVIVHIQDAHTHYECQQNILKIVDLLVEDYGLRVAAIEGGWGKLVTEPFAIYPDDDARYLAAEYLMREGRISGPEMLVVSRGIEYPLKLYGSEQQDLYERNFAAFEQALPAQRKCQQYLTELRFAIDALTRRLYMLDMTLFVTKQRSYERGYSLLSDYCFYLRDTCAERSIDVKPYQHLAAMIAVFEQEAQLDFGRAEQERAELLAELAGRLDSDQMQVLLDAGEQFRANTVSMAGYLQRVWNLAADQQLSRDAYAQLAAYTTYLEQYETIKTIDLFDEIAAVEEKLRHVLPTSDTERRLSMLAHGLTVLERMVSIKMVNRDLAFYEQHRHELTAPQYRDFIAEQARRLDMNVSVKQDMSDFDDHIRVWADFYRVAGYRDAAMVRNTLAIMAETGQSRAILVAGGFHTRELTRLMREQNLSYVVITPMITQAGETPYFDRLTGKTTILDEMVAEMQR